MKQMTQRLLLLMLALIVGLTAMPAVPSGYYNNAKNKSDQALIRNLKLK